MKKNIITFFLIFASVWLTSPLIAVESTKEEKKDYTILMPINHLSEKKVTLSVTIDKQYKSLQKLPAKLMEFIPEGDDDYKWSQIITLNMLAGLKAPASTFLSKIKEGMKTQATNFNLLEESSKNMDNYEVATLGAAYEVNGRKEVVYMRYYSGPADLAGIQYAKPLGPNESPEKVLGELKGFVDKISQVD